MLITHLLNDYNDLLLPTPLTSAKVYLALTSLPLIIISEPPLLIFSFNYRILVNKPLINPLSAVKNTNVLSSIFASVKAWKICLTTQSNSLSAPPNFPLMLEFVNCLLANWGWWVCWKSMYRKSGDDWAEVKIRITHWSK